MNVASDIYNELSTNNILGGTDGWTTYISTFIEEDLSAALINTGETQSPVNSSRLRRYSSIQILFCSVNYTIGYDKADEVYNYLYRVAAMTDYIIAPRAGIIELGKNENDLYRFSLNIDTINWEN